MLRHEAPASEAPASEETDALCLSMTVSIKKLETKSGAIVTDAPLYLLF